MAITTRYELFEIESYPYCEDCYEECTCSYKCWDINQWYKRDTLDIDEEMSDEEIIQLLIDEGYLSPKALSLVGIDDSSENCLTIRHLDSGQPLYNLICPC